MENLYDTQHIEVWMENVWLCNFLSLTLAGVTPEFLSRVFFSFVFIVTEVVVAFCSHLTIENQWTLCFQKKKKPIENKDGELGWKQDIQINLTCCVMLLNSKLPQNDSQTAQKKKKSQWVVQLQQHTVYVQTTVWTEMDCSGFQLNCRQRRTAGPKAL